MPERYLDHEGWMEELNDEAADRAERVETAEWAMVELRRMRENAERDVKEWQERAHAFEHRMYDAERERGECDERLTEMERQRTEAAHAQVAAQHRAEIAEIALEELREQYQALHAAALALLQSADDQTHPDDGFPIEEWLNLVDAVRGSNPANSQASPESRKPPSGAPGREVGGGTESLGPASRPTASPASEPEAS